MTVKQGFRTSEVAKLTGLTQRQLDHWDRTGLFRPSLAPAEGKGSARFYSFLDVVQLMAARKLREAEVSLQTLRKVVEYLRKAEGLDRPLAETRLVVSGSDVLLAEGQEQLISVLRAPGQGVLQIVLDLPKVVEELRNEVKKLRGMA
ncbi:MAG TPA: MerR family transcriptional regulator [Bacillota bacterium]|nr:MerR family transcriptional regulator [Bacillota bacterium]